MWLTAASPALTLLLATNFLVFAGESVPGLRLAWGLGGNSYTLQVSDFALTDASDTPVNTLAAVTISSLPTAG